MEDYNSKYTGEQVEEFLDQIASGELGGIVSETDPIFSASPAATITEEKITEWNSKSAQGDKGDKGDTGVGVASVAQTTTSNADGGSNVVTVTLTDGTKFTFTVKNGSKGSQGEKGDTGETGPQGPQGPQGEQGIQGVQGIQGPKGDTGATGADGAKGDKGDKGDTGAAGANGTNGVSVSSVKQTTTSTADGGTNVVTVTLSNGTTSTFSVKNGSKGSNGTNGTNGKDGTDGEDGATFTPSVDSAGNLSWSNNKGLTNPPTVNIKGPKGDAGSGGGSSSGSGAYSEVNHGTSDTTFTLTPNTFHVWDAVGELTLAFGDETADVANEYLFQFTSGSTPTTLSLPNDIRWANDSAPSISADKIYQISVLKGLASCLEFNNAAELIVFYVTLTGQPRQFVCPPNMTWNEFVVSEYNTGDYILRIDGDLIMWASFAINDQTPSDTIENLMTYTTYYAD